MKNLFRFEFHKLFRQKSFYVCSAIMVAFTILTVILMQMVVKNTPELVESGLLTTPTTVWDIVLSMLNSANFFLISVIFVAIYVCDDFSNGAIKNVYSHGYSKTKVFFSKLLVVLSGVMIMYVANIILSLVIGLICFSTAAAPANLAGLLFGQIFLVVSYTILAFSISICLKKLGPSIAFIILGPIAVSLVFSLIDTALNLETIKLVDYWLDSFNTSLGVASTSATRIVECIIGSIIYGGAFLYAGWSVNKKLENY